jgi:ABC-2 type transport system permease protein
MRGLVRAITKPFRVIWSVLTELGRQIVRVSSFFLKEIWAALRQPKLIMSVVLGPFLILAAFGIGYKGQTPQLGTTLVLPNDPRLPEDPAAYRDLFSSVFILEGVTRDRAAAEAALQSGRTDVVVVVPNDAENQVLGGEHAEFAVLFNESDPLQAAWVRYFATVAIQELNRRVLAGLVGNAQEPADQLAGAAGQMRAQAEALEGDLRAGNPIAAGARVIGLRQTLQTVRSLPAFSPMLAITGEADPFAPIEQELAEMERDLLAGRVNTPEQLRRAASIRENAQQLEQQARRLTDIPPDVLVAPFSVQAQNTVPVEPTPIAFFAPAVIALLLQHIAISLTSLSMVRDRLLGAMDIYRVAPIGPMEVLLGKSLSYGLLLSIVAALLVFLVTRLLNVPILGNPLWVAVSLGLLLFASLGMGFFLSGLASSETQAVQLAMLVLLCSIFFGGFFLALTTLWEPIRAISYVLPVTFGSIDLRDVMLRGVAPDPLMLAAPALLGLIMYALAARSVSREMATQ